MKKILFIIGSLRAKSFNRQVANAANPIQKGLKPLLTFDVWEQARAIGRGGRDV